MSADPEVDTRPATATTKHRDMAGAWRMLGVVGGLIAIGVALYWPTVRSLIVEWENLDSLTYTHGYLVAVLSLWLVFRNRFMMEAGRLQWSPRAAAVLLLSSALWLVALRAGIEIIHQLLLPLILWLAVYTVARRRIAWACAPGLLYFYFAIPIWSFGNDILQYLTVHAVRVILALSGVSAYVVDNFVHIQSGIFEIAGGCSGLHFFIVALAIAALYGEVQRDSMKIRAALILLAAVLGVVSNWIRVSSIIVAGYLTDMQHSLITEGHYYFGWKVFAVTMVVFFLLARRLPISTSAVAAEGHCPAGNAMSPATGRFAGVFTVGALGLAVALAAMSFGPLWAALTPAARPVTDTVMLLPDELPDWQPENVPVDWQPVFVGADRTRQQTYHSNGQVVSAFAGIYYEQRQGKEMVGYDNTMTGTAQMQIVAVRRVELADGVFNELQTQGTNRAQALFWYRYEVGGSRTVSNLASQLLYGFKSLSGPPVSNVWVLRSNCGQDCNAARQTLNEFAGQLLEWQRHNKTANPRGSRD